jgi:hypothetical protein
MGANPGIALLRVRYFAKFLQLFFVVFDFQWTAR